MIEDISNWESEILNAVPIGKRLKRTCYAPEAGDLYYFKEPESKYPWEFWTEVIASDIGYQLGFNTLEYFAAIHGERAGCLSPSMVKSNEDLIHGQQYLIQKMPQFDKKKGSDHSFEMVERVFMENALLKPLWKDFIEMLVFDAIIGNHDRHQQNWAIIRTLIISFKDEKTKKEETLFEKILRKIMRFLDKKGGTHGPIFEKVVDIDSISEQLSFSSLFDNGNSLAYNILEENIPVFLTDQDRFEKYLFGNKATSHLKWENREIGYIELLEKIQEIYPVEVGEAVALVRKKYKKNEIEQIIVNVDHGFPETHNQYKLTPLRKELMIKIVIARTEELLRRIK